MSTPASRPWERLEVRAQPGFWEIVGIQPNGKEDRVAVSVRRFDADYLADGYNARCRDDRKEGG